MRAERRAVAVGVGGAGRHGHAAQALVLCGTDALGGAAAAPGSLHWFRCWWADEPAPLTTASIFCQPPALPAVDTSAQRSEGGDEWRLGKQLWHQARPASRGKRRWGQQVWH